MKGPDKLWRLVTFISKSLSDTERNYEIHDKEMLAVVRCLEAWRHFLEETMTRFEIWTDHKNLEYFIKVQKLNRRSEMDIIPIEVQFYAKACSRE